MSGPGMGTECMRRLSLIVPAFNEAENLEPLYKRICAALGDDPEWELVLVDDGSTDGTAEVVRALSREDPRVRGLILERNCGQSTAIFMGIDQARGQLIATLDADLQNDPADLPGMLEALGDFDAIVGYRLGRCDSWVRRASSRVANAVRNALSGDDIRDTGCSLKVFRADAIRSVPVFDGMHRFLPTLLRFQGYRVKEHPVTHHPRVAGTSKYGIRNRVFRGLVDLLAVTWMRSRMIWPRIREIVEPGE